MRRKRGPTVRVEWTWWAAAEGLSLTNGQWFRVGQTVRDRRPRHKDRAKIVAVIRDVYAGRAT